MRKLYYPISLILLCLMLSGWGSKGHKKISQNFANALPSEISFLRPSWTNFVGSHASDADYRKDQDPDESQRHFIDIDNYPEFIQNGRISQDYDSVIAQHGYNFVIGEGVLPWATINTYDSLKSCFQRGDWNRSALFAADLGHYVGDGHMPLHITKNYNGQMTGQSGIHSRYETSMISRYESQIVYTVDTVEFIGDVNGFIFNYLYTNYSYVDSVLLAETYAKTIGNLGSDPYYQALWAKSGSFTTMLMQHASKSLASLIYTAWVEAGSPMMYPNAIDETSSDQPLVLQLFPNPAIDYVWIPLNISEYHTVSTIRIYDSAGNLKESFEIRPTEPGIHKVRWNCRGLSPGVYLCVVQSGDNFESRKIILEK